MNITIELGQEKDIEVLENLYNDLNDALAEGINYPKWRKGIYPSRQNAVDGIKNKTLYVAKQEDKIVGTIILNHEPEEAYEQVKWQKVCSDQEIYVIHTFAVHPNYAQCGIGRLLMDFAYQKAVKSKMKALRLDVYEGNAPARKLYEKCGFIYIDTVDLGLGAYDLDWFRLYERLILE